jgi:hypothetical protein
VEETKGHGPEKVMNEATGSRTEGPDEEQEFPPVNNDEEPE